MTMKKKNKSTSTKTNTAMPRGGDPPAKVFHGGAFTHVIVAIEAYNSLVQDSAELEAIRALGELDRDGADASSSDDWIDGEDFAAEVAADALLSARKEKGLTQQQLAKKVGIPQSQISRIERNPDRTTVKTMRKIAKALGVDVSRILPR